MRSIFFPTPGGTLGSGRLRVLSQAQVDNRAHPTDGQYVENVMWQRDGILFVSVNVPGGSNNDADPWYGAPTASPQQTTEAANRTGAALRWLDRAFTTAGRIRARSVVVMTQADMWDLDGKDASHLANYEPIVSSLATHTTSYGKPVLLLNGDSHVYRSDNPLQQGSAVRRGRGRLLLRRLEQPPVLRRAELPPHRGPRQHRPAGVPPPDRPRQDPADDRHLVRAVLLAEGDRLSLG